MRYAQHRSNYKAPKPEGHEKRSRKIILIGFGLLVIAIVIFAILNQNKDEDEHTNSEEHIAAVTVEIDIPDVVDELRGEVQQIDLIDVLGVGSGGFARRGTAGELFTHVVVANLPQIDYSTDFYEGWLVKPGVVEFFSTGEMFPRADGEYGLVWETSLSEARVDLDDFVRVVITEEPRDGDPAPALHLLEGDF